MWKYILYRGIYNSEKECTVFFGCDRFELRQLFSYTYPDNKGRFEYEDSYDNVFGANDYIRFTFDSNQTLRSIEVLNGSVEVNGINIAIEGDLRDTMLALNQIGIIFIEDELGYFCKNLNFDIGDAEKNGGEENKICWFYTAKDLLMS